MLNRERSLCLLKCTGFCLLWHLKKRLCTIIYPIFPLISYVRLHTSASHTACHRPLIGEDRQRQKMFWHSQYLGPAAQLQDGRHIHIFSDELFRFRQRE